LYYTQNIHKKQQNKKAQDNPCLLDKFKNQRATLFIVCCIKNVASKNAVPNCPQFKLAKDLL
jgi:hypothetical protein